MFALVVERTRAERLAVRGYVPMCSVTPWEGDVPVEHLVDVVGRLLLLRRAELSARGSAPLVRCPSPSASRTESGTTALRTVNAP